MTAKKSAAAQRREIEQGIAEAIDAAMAARKGVVFVGGSLSLHVRGGSALWRYTYREGAKTRTRHLGSAADMSLHAARKERERQAALRRGARIETRQSHDNSNGDRSSADHVETRKRFAVVLDEYLTRYKPEWKASNRDKEEHNYRKLGDTALGAMWVDEITTADVERALTKGWGHAAASMDKHRMRLGKIFGFAKAKRYVGEHQPNPADKKIMEHLLPKPPKVKHHKPMPSAELPEFMAELMRDHSPEARALAFCILTNVRTNEARDIDWSEIDGNVWTVPGGLDGRMKEGEIFRVWLSPAALALLGKRKKSGHVFGDLAHDALIEKLRALRPGKDYTVHGFRTTFKGDWALRARYPVEEREMAIGHAIGTEQTKGYNLPPEELYSVLIPLRQAWSDFAMSEAK